MSPVTSVLFVCLGNICRSPTAEGVFRALARAEGRERDFRIDSAGTGAWHVGHEPDARMTEAAREAGYTLGGRARRVRAADFERFDLVLAMDRSNRRDLLDLAPPEHVGKVRLFRELDPEGPGEDVPDPYYGDEDGFHDVVRIVERTSRAWLRELTGR